MLKTEKKKAGKVLKSLTFGAVKNYASDAQLQQLFSRIIAADIISSVLSSGLSELYPVYDTIDELLSVFQSTKYLGGTRNCAAQGRVPLFKPSGCVLRWNESH